MIEREGRHVTNDQSQRRRLLELEPPEVDALGRTVWGVPSADVSKAYRRLSVLVHPDKNPGADARAAFECLNEAHRLLRNRGQLVRLLSAYSSRMRKRSRPGQIAGVKDRATAGVRLECAAPVRVGGAVFTAC